MTTLAPQMQEVEPTRAAAVPDHAADVKAEGEKIYALYSFLKSLMDDRINSAAQYQRLGSHYEGSAKLELERAAVFAPWVELIADFLSVYTDDELGTDAVAALRAGGMA